MSRDSDKGQSERDAPWAMSVEAKPTYEAPVVIPLGEVARGFGAACGPGSSASGVSPSCWSGYTAGGAFPSCVDGDFPKS